MSTEWDDEVGRRIVIHAALADPGRLAIVDALLLADSSPSELQKLLSMPSNLMAHHLGVLEQAGMLRRVRSEGDRRRTYLQLIPEALELGPQSVGGRGVEASQPPAGGIGGHPSRRCCPSGRAGRGSASAPTDAPT
jgi:DNA-binding transcriptional ArsR family regulator